MTPPHPMAVEPEEAPVSRSMLRAVVQLAQLRRDLALEVHLASSDAREDYRVLAPELEDLERYLDGTVEENVVKVRELLARAVDLYDRVRHSRSAPSVR